MGGAGGGAFEWIALGELVLNGNFRALGANGGPAQPPPFQPGTGFSGTSAFGRTNGQGSGGAGSGNGGGGGSSFSGAPGGAGGRAGLGQAGGGGAGGTVRLIAARITAGSAGIDVRGGFAGAVPFTAADNGRAVLGSNVALPASGIGVSGTRVNTFGPRAPSPYPPFAPPTPYLVGISTIATPHDVVPAVDVPVAPFTAVPANAVLAAARFATSSAPFDVAVPGFDYVLIANLSNAAVSFPRTSFGFAARTAVVSLQRGGWTTEPRFGGFLQTIDALLPGEGFVFMVPEAMAGSINLGGIVGGSSCIVRSPLARGDTMAMTSPPCDVAEAGTLSQFIDGFEDR